MFTTTRANRVCKSFFFFSFSLSTELLEDKPGFKLGWVDMSPSYLLFQTLLPLFWTLTCMIWMELTRTDVVFSRIAMVLFYVQKIEILRMTWNSTEHLRKNNKKPSPKMKTRGPTPYPRGCPTPLLGPLVALRHQLQLHILAFGEKKIREKKSSRFTIRSRRQALISLGRDDLESVRGSGEGDSSPSSSSTILHHQFHDAHRLEWVITS